MTMDEMREGLKRGRTLIQEEWADPDEIRAADLLQAQGEADVGPWAYKEGFQCERRIIRALKGEGNG